MKVIISVVMTMLLSVPLGSLAEARQRDIPLRPPVRCNICAANGLSQAVVTGTFASLNQLQARLKAGTARSADVQQTLATVRIFFAHLDETGVTKSLEESILNRQEDIIRYTPNRADAELLAKRHASMGVKTTADEHLRNMEALTVNDRMQFIAAIKEGGLRPYYAHVVSHLESLGDKMAKAEKSGSQFTPVVWAGNGCDYDLVAGIAGIGCVFGCLGCCLVAAFAKLFQVLECSDRIGKEKK